MCVCAPPCVVHLKIRRSKYIQCVVFFGIVLLSSSPGTREEVDRANMSQTLPDEVQVALQTATAAYGAVIHSFKGARKQSELLRCAMGLHAGDSSFSSMPRMSAEEWATVVGWASKTTDCPSRRERLLSALQVGYAFASDEAVLGWRGDYVMKRHVTQGRERWIVSWPSGSPFEVLGKLRMANAALGRAIRMLRKWNRCTTVEASAEYDADEASLERECVICMADMRGASRTTPPCGHMFHTSCLKRWLREHSPHSCPTCRRPVIMW